MKLNLLKDKGTPIQDQSFTWKELVQLPISKLKDDSFTRVHILLMSGLELEGHRFSHACSRMNRELQTPLAIIRRIQQHQGILLQGLIGPDHTFMDQAIAHEQMNIEITARIAQNEENDSLKSIYQKSLLENVDHLYRFSALMDRLEGRDANAVLQSKTEINPGRPTYREHRDPHDDIKKPYQKKTASILTKFHALTALSMEEKSLNLYMSIGPTFGDPTARQLYAEISSLKEQHMTSYESMVDPEETWLEKFLLHKANEVYQYSNCLENEINPRIRKIWERFLDYKLGQLQAAMELYRQIEKKDPLEILSEELPIPAEQLDHKDFIHELNNKMKAEIKDIENKWTLKYRGQVNAEGSPSEVISSGYKWKPGTELSL